MSVKKLKFKNPERITGDSKIYVYQSKRDFEPEEAESIEHELDRFVAGWNRKPNVDFADYSLFENHFIIIAVVRNRNSDIDCSLDTPANNVIRKLDKTLDLGLVRPMQISYRTDGKIHTVSLSAFRQLLSESEVGEDVTVFHTGVYSLDEFDRSWELPLNRSWVSGMLKAAGRS